MSKKSKKSICIGGLVGKSVGGRIENCHVSGKIIIDGVETDINAGGLVGHAENTEITNSTSDVDIQIVENRKFEELKELIVQNLSDKNEINELIALIEVMRNKKRTKNYLSAYINFISVMADHITLISPFIPFLTQLIIK